MSYRYHVVEGDFDVRELNGKDLLPWTTTCNHTPGKEMWLLYSNGRFCVASSSLGAIRRRVRIFLG